MLLPLVSPFCKEASQIGLQSGSFNCYKITLWHEIIAKIIPWELFFVKLEGFYTLKISGKEGLFQEITYEIRNFSKIIISE